MSKEMLELADELARFKSHCKCNEDQAEDGCDGTFCIGQRDAILATLRASAVAEPGTTPAAPVSASVREALEKIACNHVTEQPLWWQLEARRALASLPAPEAAPTREEIAERAALSTWERIIRQFFADGRGRVSAGKALDAILALKAAPAK